MVRSEAQRREAVDNVATQSRGLMKIGGPTVMRLTMRRDLRFLILGILLIGAGCGGSRGPGASQNSGTTASTNSSGVGAQPTPAQNINIYDNSSGTPSNPNTSTVNTNAPSNTKLPTTAASPKAGRISAPPASAPSFITPSTTTHTKLPTPTPPA